MAKYGNRYIPNIIKKSRTDRNSIGWALRTVDKEGSVIYKNDEYEFTYNDKTVIKLSDLITPATATLQGNTFNGADQLVQLDSSSRLPAVDGSLLTNIPAGNPFNQSLNTSDSVSFSTGQFTEAQFGTGGYGITIGEQLYFGTEDTGFGAVAGADLGIAIDGVDTWEFLGNHFRSSTSAYEGPLLRGVNSTVGTPTLVPNRSYSTSGIGSTGDEVRIITLGSTAAVFNNVGNLTTTGDVNGRDMGADGASLDALEIAVPALESDVDSLETIVGQNVPHSINLGYNPAFTNKGVFTTGYTDTFFSCLSMGNITLASGVSGDATFGPSGDNVDFFKLNTSSTFMGTLEIIGRSSDLTSTIRDKYTYTIARGVGGVLENQLTLIPEYTSVTAGLSYTLSIDYSTTPGEVVFNIDNTSVSTAIDFIVVLDGFMYNPGD